MLINHRFTDIGQLSELARNWDLNFQQTQAGPLSAHLLQQQNPEFGFALVEVSRCIKQEGVPQLAGRSFALLRRPSPHLWYDATISYNDVLAFHPTEGFQSVSAPRFSCFVVSVSEACWRKQLEDRRLSARAKYYRPVLRARPGLVIRLRRALESYYWQLILGATTRAPERIMQADCLDALLDVLESAARNYSAETRATASARGKALRRACDFIYSCDGAPITLSELCSVARVSERTLQYAFLQHTGQSPKRFIRSYRPGRVRDELLSVNERESIGAVAARWGFSHMGQFARYYRDQFGELPSHT